MTVAVIEYTDPAQMIADYAARRKRLYQPRRPAIAAPKPALVVEEPPPVDALAQYRLAYESAIPANGYVQIAKRIIKETAAECGLRSDDLLGKCRTPSFARARQLAIWRVAKETPLSLTKIGHVFHGRDHTTVLHAIRRMNDFFGEDVRGTGGVKGVKVLSWAAAKASAA